MCFVDLKAAYDSVDREALLMVLGRYGVSQKLRSLIKAVRGNEGCGAGEWRTDRVVQRGGGP